MDIVESKELVCISAEEIENTLKEIFLELTGSDKYKVSVSSLSFKRGDGGKQQVTFTANVGEDHRFGGW
ncbi:hypothetical protein [Microbulbifer sp.]|uniref:hypothetical protein n=1 Tax=Microbulbifer sp. TaxID=1908541 RepID=UPI002588A74C|nr:hypothetical protein [Microbulbifer sp.]